IDPDRQHLDIVPVLQFVDTAGEEGRDLHEVFPKRLQTLLPDLVEGSLGDYVCALPIIAAIQRNQDFPRPEAAECLIGILRPAREPHPKHINRGSDVDHFEASLLTHRGMTAIRSYRQVRAYFERAVRSLAA